MRWGINGVKYIDVLRYVHNEYATRNISTARLHLDLLDDYWKGSDVPLAWIPRLNLAPERCPIERSFAVLLFACDVVRNSGGGGSLWSSLARYIRALILKFHALQELKESFNYGLFCPPVNGKAGKFLDEERRLGDYPFNGPVGYLEVRDIFFFISATFFPPSNCIRLLSDRGNFVRYIWVAEMRQHTVYHSAGQTVIIGFSAEQRLPVLVAEGLSSFLAWALRLSAGPLHAW